MGHFLVDFIKVASLTQATQAQNFLMKAYN